MPRKQLRPASAAEQFIKTAEEKKHPTAEELEAQGQQKLFEEKEAQKPKPRVRKEQTKATTATTQAVVKEPAETQKMGQPKKYTEPTKHVSFSLPVSVIENLKILAGLKKTNQTQLIIGMINKEIEKEANKINAYKELLK